MKLLFLALTVCVATGIVYGEDVVREETITATLAADKPVSICNINGDITVEGWDSDQVEVVYIITCDDQEEMDAIDVLCDLSNGIECEVEYDADWNDNHSGEVVFLVKVPENLALDYELIDVNGDVSMSSACGTVCIEVVNGDITATNFDGEAVIDLVNGSVAAFGIPELDEINIVNGDITCVVSELNNDLYLSGVNGEITVDLAAAVIVEIETINGDIDVSDSFNARIEEQIVGASATFGEGEHVIVISTVSGDIEIND